MDLKFMSEMNRNKNTNKWKGIKFDLYVKYLKWVLCISTWTFCSFNKLFTISNMIMNYVWITNILVVLQFPWNVILNILLSRVLIGCRHEHLSFIIYWFMVSNFMPFCCLLFRFLAHQRITGNLNSYHDHILVFWIADDHIWFRITRFVILFN